VPLFRRREPLHERLAREGGLDPRPLPETGPFGWMETGIHGVPRHREWDAVVAIEAEGIEGDQARFVALADETLLVEEGEDVEPLAQALDDVVQPPYRAEAVRRGESQWAVGVRRIEVVELEDDPEGETLTLTSRDGERTLLVDGSPAFGSIPALERLGAARAESYVIEGQRLTEGIWEVRVTAL
jgi:hypothetical protein